MCTLQMLQHPRMERFSRCFCLLEVASPCLGAEAQRGQSLCGEGHPWSKSGCKKGEHSEGFFFFFFAWFALFS